MKKHDALIYLGLLFALVILSLFIGATIGEMIGHKRGVAEAEKIFLGRMK